MFSIMDIVCSIKMARSFTRVLLPLSIVQLTLYRGKILKANLVLIFSCFYFLSEVFWKKKKVLPSAGTWTRSSEISISASESWYTESWGCPGGWPDTVPSSVNALIALTLILKSFLFFLWNETINASGMPGFLGKGSFFGDNILARIMVVVACACVCVWRGGGNGEGISFVEWLWPKKLLGSGNLLEEYCRNISVRWVLHILSNKSTCKTALQWRL